MPGIASPTLPKQTASTGKKLLLPFILVTSLFFFWGFVHNLDPILIPHLRKAFLLNDLQSSLVDSAVFIAYFLMALPAGYVMRKYGYKSGILLGLVFFGIGCFLFYTSRRYQAVHIFSGCIVRYCLWACLSRNSSQSLCHCTGPIPNGYPTAEPRPIIQWTGRHGGPADWWQIHPFRKKLFRS